MHPTVSQFPSHLRSLANTFIDRYESLSEKQKRLFWYFVDNYKYKLYDPWNKVAGQDAYHGQRDFHTRPGRIRIITGGNRTGKTEAGAHEIAWHATGDYPDYYPENMRFQQPVKIRVICQDFKKQE